eukprot:SAG22_NODE_1654_length_3892_cov_20.221197_2_plen_170_part_00
MATFTLGGCAAGQASLVFLYANGNTDTRPLTLTVNGVTQPNALNFGPTGGWDRGDGRNKDAVVQLVAGHNTISLTTAGQNGPNLSRWPAAGGGDIKPAATGTGCSIAASGHYSIFADDFSASTATAAAPARPPASTLPPRRRHPGGGDRPWLLHRGQRPSTSEVVSPTG